MQDPEWALPVMADWAVQLPRRQAPQPPPAMLQRQERREQKVLGALSPRFRRAVSTCSRPLPESAFPGSYPRTKNGPGRLPHSPEWTSPRPGPAARPRAGLAETLPGPARRPAREQERRPWRAPAPPALEVGRRVKMWAAAARACSRQAASIPTKRLLPYRAPFAPHGHLDSSIAHACPKFTSARGKWRWQEHVAPQAPM